MKKPASLLKIFLERKKKTQPSYSLRALARDLKVSPSFLSEVINGKKKLSLERIDRTVTVLDLDSQDAMDLKIAYLPASLREPARTASKSRARKTDYDRVDRQQNGILRHWYYLAILDLTTCVDFKGQESEIARRLGLHPETVQVAVRELQHRGFLIEKDGRLKKAKNALHFSSSKHLEEIRSFHSQLLDKAKKELSTNSDSESVDKRLISGITFAADPKRIKMAKKLLSDCLHEIASLLAESDNCTEVYHVAAQLFPLSRLTVEPSE